MFWRKPRDSSSRVGWTSRMGKRSFAVRLAAPLMDCVASIGGMGTLYERIKPFAAFAGEVVAETLWPTRCAVCDVLGKVLCDRCAASLPYLDWWRACRRCGAAYGYVQCASCNPVALGLVGRTELPFEACTSATMFSPRTGKIVRVFKDQGERRLASTMAMMMQRAMPPDWVFDVIVHVPATKAAYRRRGFDHAELIARSLSDRTGIMLVDGLARPRTHDQRKLTGAQRVANLAGSFGAHPDACCGRRILLVDDVYTTGATLCAATDALLAVGAREVRCLTFARV